jgi:hypothetical protein
MRNVENTPIFYKSQALHIAKIVLNSTDWDDRLAAFRIALVINETKTQKFVTP